MRYYLGLALACAITWSFIIGYFWLLSWAERTGREGVQALLIFTPIVAMLAAALTIDADGYY